MPNNFVTVDIGNSSPNFMLHESGQIKGPFPIVKWQEHLRELPHFVSSVSSYDLPAESIIDFSHHKKDRLFMDMPMNYTATIGDDRIIQAYYLYKHFINKSFCLIDAGTFTTIDFISKTGFEGGYIIPSKSTLAKCFYNQGSKLPDIKSSSEFLVDRIPHSTEEAIGTTVEIMFGQTIKHISNKINSSYKIVITGGRYLELLEHIKVYNSIEIIPNLLHHSLAYLGNREALK